MKTCSLIHQPVRGLRTRDRREAGSLLVELAMAIPVFIIGALGLLYALQSNFKGTRQLIGEDYSSAAMSNMLERIYNTPFEDVYSTFNSMYHDPGVMPTSGTTGVDDLNEYKWSLGSNGQVYVDFFVDELSMPWLFGPIVDLDGDGVAATSDCSTTYKILPTRLLSWYYFSDHWVLRRMYVVIGTKNPT